MKLSEVKKLTIGSELRLVRIGNQSCSKRRIVAHKDTVKLGFIGDEIPPNRISYLEFPKAARFDSTPEGFCIRVDDQGFVLEYKLIKQAQQS